MHKKCFEISNENKIIKVCGCKGLLRVIFDCSFDWVRTTPLTLDNSIASTLPLKYSFCQIDYWLLYMGLYLMLNANLQSDFY